jgi:hypothetical protein
MDFSIIHANQPGQAANVIATIGQALVNHLTINTKIYTNSNTLRATQAEL